MSATLGEFERLRVVREGSVLLVGIDRPDKRNAMDRKMSEELAQLFERARRAEPHILILHSTTPGIFVAGADLREMLERDPDDGLAALNPRLFERIEEHRWPTIAVVDGAALGGGCELALACDLRVATPRAQFGQPELGLGILAAGGANWRLAQTVGTPVARRMLYAGERLSAEQAQAHGLVDAIAEPDAVLEHARQLAARITRQSWRALELTKLALRLNRPATTTFDQAAQALAFAGDEKRERITAFLEGARR